MDRESKQGNVLLTGLTGKKLMNTTHQQQSPLLQQPRNQKAKRMKSSKSLDHSLITSMSNLLEALQLNHLFRQQNQRRYCRTGLDLEAPPLQILSLLMLRFMKYIPNPNTKILLVHHTFMPMMNIMMNTMIMNTMPNLNWTKLKILSTLK